MTVEMELYLGLKKYLRKAGWMILGGQPPSGSDHLPVIEIKLNHGGEKGSKHAFKPDLLALRANQIMLFEIKPDFSQADYDKLKSVLDSDLRIESLWKELAERNIRDETGGLLSNRSTEIHLQCALVYRQPISKVQRVWTFLWEHGEFKEFPPSP